ncbi:sigma-70 family RNA polymerase sigma factor [Candidatus Woesearchaeota archaeon]|nr:sigma-70 family RNA polymerase sigma factor [Candidatus Woesearchaeota archaeon]
MIHINLYKPSGWDKINALGREYHALVQAGYGTTVERRSPEQKRIVNKILARTAPYIQKIAMDLVNGRSHPVNSRVKVSLRGTNYPIDDLVQEGVIAVVETFQNYNPTKGSVSTFLTYTVVSRMYKAGMENKGIIRLPISIAKLRNALNSETKGEAINIIKLRMGAAGRRCSTEEAFHIYFALRGNFNQRHSDKNGEKNSPSAKYPSETEDLPSQDPSPEEQADKAELTERIEKILSTLSKPERIVLKLSFGISAPEIKNENGKEYALEEIAHTVSINGKQVSRERIRQIRARAIQRLHCPHYARQLDDFL